MKPTTPLLLSLHRSVQAALDAGHVGVPLFVRCVAHTAPDRDGLTDQMRHLVAVAGAWLGAVPRRLYAQGGVEAGQITVTLQYAGGQSALVSVNLAADDGGPCIDLMLLGSTGALYHEGAALPSNAAIALGGPSGDLPPLPDALATAIDQSLHTRVPIPVASSATPSTLP